MIPKVILSESGKQAFITAWMKWIADMEIEEVRTYGNVEASLRRKWRREYYDKIKFPDRQEQLTIDNNESIQID